MAPLPFKQSPVGVPQGDKEGTAHRTTRREQGMGLDPTELGLLLRRYAHGKAAWPFFGGRGGGGAVRPGHGRTPLKGHRGALHDRGRVGAEAL